MNLTEKLALEKGLSEFRILSFKALSNLLDLKVLILDNKLNDKVCKRFYTTLKSIINLYKYRIDDLDYLIEKYCKEEKE